MKGLDRADRTAGDCTTTEAARLDAAPEDPTVPQTPAPVATRAATRRVPVRVRRGSSELVLVPLAGDRGTATVDADAFDRLMAEGVSDQWFVGHDGGGRDYVCVANPERRGGLNMVARLILGPGPGGIVRYRNGDRMDLRWFNLMVTERVQKASRK